MSIVDGISFEVEKVDRGYWRWIGTSPVYGLVEGGDDAYRTKAEATAALRYYLEHRAEYLAKRKAYYGGDLKGLAEASGADFVQELRQRAVSDNEALAVYLDHLEATGVPKAQRQVEHARVLARRSFASSVMIGEDQIKSKVEDVEWENPELVWRTVLTLARVMRQFPPQTINLPRGLLPIMSASTNVVRRYAWNVTAFSGVHSVVAEVVGPTPTGFDVPLHPLRLTVVAARLELSWGISARAVVKLHRAGSGWYTNANRDVTLARLPSGSGGSVGR